MHIFPQQLFSLHFYSMGLVSMVQSWTSYWGNDKIFAKKNAEVFPEEHEILKLAEEAQVHTKTEQAREDTARVDKSSSDSGHENSYAQRDLEKDLTVLDKVCP